MEQEICLSASNDGHRWLVVLFQDVPGRQDDTSIVQNIPCSYAFLFLGRAAGDNATACLLTLASGSLPPCLQPCGFAEGIWQIACPPPLIPRPWIFFFSHSSLFLPLFFFFFLFHIFCRIFGEAIHTTSSSPSSSSSSGTMPLLGSTIPLVPSP